MMRLLNRLKSLRDTRKHEREEKASRPISPTDAHAILRIERRQHIVAYLATCDPSEEVTAGELADHLETLGDQREAAYVSVIQSHLPRMARSQLIAYDDETRELRPTDVLYRVHEAHEAFEAALG